MPDLTIGIDPIEHDQPAGDYAAVLAKLPPVFAACCGPNTARFDLSGPWVTYGFAYATDGRIIVRMPVDAALAAEITAARPKSARAPSNGPKVFAGRWVDTALPPPVYDPGHECSNCKGKGWLAVKACGACEGSGSTECLTCGEHRDCRDCYGRGFVASAKDRMPCRACGGGGIKSFASFKIGTMTLAADLVRTIRDAGGVLYPARQHAHRKPVRWVVPGTAIEGVVMPMTD